ncbi:HlyD family secretion protein [Dictyobacter arantiisoli]|uniref:Multidrug efflux protein n=1 Tax=Dictyobacter arantiisoli TaxID=2014874 RepID=A0A5A5TG94_9CHLR|nr:HlyD family efflux transporter periplasmic adaptor subunit [Dictyobacter arantiisoli]GCF10245.1 multidrug efflux protein [Dictyobacter arantiisoli]
MRRTVLVTVLIVVAILAAAGGLGYYFYNSYLYYTIDDAQVTGTILPVASPGSGQIDTLAVKLGDKVTANEVIGTVLVTPATGGKPVDVKVSSPIDGTVVQDSVVVGQAVAAGTPLIQVTNLNNLTVTAYVDEGRINDVKVNQEVDVTIDAFSGTSYKGHIQTIVAATAGSFSLLPTNDNTSGNFSKVSQRVPVVITLDSNGSNNVVPGLSAEATIHLH